jgi:acetyltransferase-like isoleucine patch superfamily enzyme
MNTLFWSFMFRVSLMLKRLVKKNRLVYVKLRRLYMWYLKKRLGLKSVGKDCWISSRVNLIHPSVVIGDFSFVARNATIYPNVSIGRFCLIAPNVSILGGDHRFNLVGSPMCFSGREDIKETIIGEDVWVGANSILLHGICIGEGAIIAAGSVVTKDVKAYSIVGGNPAKHIRYRFSNVSDQMKHSESLKHIHDLGELVNEL